MASAVGVQGSVKNCGLLPNWHHAPKDHVTTLHQGLPGGPVATNSQHGAAGFDPQSEAPTLPPADEKSRLTGKDPDAGKD